VSSSELIEHAGYFRDSRKISAYQQALDNVVREGDVVVDLGAGTGLLGLLALRAGAGRVYMVDRGSILGPAQEIAARNGFADRMVAVRGSSTDIVLPERADVIVCDQIGGFVYDAGVLDFFDDARRRLLKPG
jgi:predicted RNA methylase